MLLHREVQWTLGGSFLVRRVPAAAISRSDDLRRQNKRRILGALRANRTLSRTELAAATGLSASTVTAATSELIETGHLVLADIQDFGDTRGKGAGRGRPRVALSRRPEAASIAALTITVNQIQAELVDFAGDTVCKIAEPADHASMTRQDLGPRLVALVRKAIASAPVPVGPLASVAIGVQGVVDAAGEMVFWSPLSRHRDVGLAAELSQALGADVRLANDANMIATALHQDNPDRYGENFATVLLSYGVGMGMFLHGDLFRGARTSAAEFGHMPYAPGGALCRCGRLGCVEAYASEYGIWRLATGADTTRMPDALPELPTMIRLAELAAGSDERAANAYRVAGAALGRGLLGVFTIFDAMTVAFVGSGTLGFAVMEPEIRKALAGPSTGLSYENAAMFCHLKEFDLMSRGSIITALTNLDQSIDLDRVYAGP